MSLRALLNLGSLFKECCTFLMKQFIFILHVMINFSSLEKVQKVWKKLHTLQKAEQASVTRLGNFLHFGQPFKTGGNNYFRQIAHIVRQFLESCQNHSFFSEIIFGHFLQTFVRFLFGHTGNGTPSISLKTRGKRSYVQKLLMLIDWLTQSLEIYLTLSRAKSSFDLDPKMIT